MSFDKNIKALGHLSKAIAISIGILILTSFVAVYGMNTIADKPEYRDFCQETFNINTEAECIAIDGDWINYSRGEIVGGNCSPPKECNSEYNDAQESYSRSIFLMAVPLGILIIVLGAFVFSLNSVGVGLMLGGVYTLIYGAARYWRYGADWARFLISLVGLVALILIAYRFSQKKK